MSPGLPEKYSVDRKIATGGMSEVYLCRLRGEEGFEKKVAVKVIHPRFSDDRHFRERFVREARIAASLSHQNLVQVFDFGRGERSYYLAMEFVEGWNLAQVTSQLRLRSIPIPLAVWRHWVTGMLEGIAYLHARKIIHRDISPSNVLVTRGGAVKITDLGIAKGAQFVPDKAKGWEGKFSYMSPEVARGGNANYFSDLFSAAVIAAELFLPEKLFGGKDEREIVERLKGFTTETLPFDRFPSGISKILEKGLSQRISDRYRDASSFAVAIAEAVPGTASRIDLVSFWDELFPGTGHGDEDTVLVDGPSPAGVPGMIREKREGYGIAYGRGVRIGVASALVAVVVGGGWLWWKAGAGDERNLSSRERISGISVSTTDIVPEPPGGQDAVPGSGPASGSFFPQDAGNSGNLPVSERKQQDPVPSLSIRGRKVLLETEPEGVTVTLEEGPYLGVTPFALDAAELSGKKVVFRKEGYLARTLSADSLSQLARLRIALEPQMGTVEVVQAIPWAKVYVKGKYLGVTPLSSLSLSVGKHRLRFVNEPLGIDRVETVDVRPGPNPKLIIRMLGDQ